MYNKDYYSIFNILNKIDNSIVFVSTLFNLYHYFVDYIDIAMVKIYILKNKDIKEDIVLYENENNDKDVLKYNVLKQEYKLNEYFDMRIETYKSNDLNEDECFYLNNLHDTLFNLYQLKKYQDKIKKLEVTDNITNVFNTKGIVNFGEKLKIENKIDEYSCVFLNIKNFKSISERIGNECRDILLCKYAKEIKKHLKENENIGRIGGDNFVIIMKQKNIDLLLSLIKDVIIKPIDGEDISCKMSYRCGIRDLDITLDINQAIIQANLAINTLRQKGVGDVLYYDENMSIVFFENKEIEKNFKNALNNKEFVVFYQPKVTTNDYTLCGGEALVRWKKDDKYIPPNKFIPILEQDLSICELDMYVLEQVCLDIRKWLNKGLIPPKISVNFSKNHFKKGEFANDILNILEKYNIESKYIEIELTETSAYYAKEVLTHFIEIMQKHNISISMDDFGVGDSSLNLLKTLQFDIIKFDKTFIDGILSDCNKDRILLTSLMLMIHKLGMTTVAEGVETKEQVDFLKRIGCDIIQGYYFDKPLLVEDFEKRIIEKT